MATNKKLMLTGPKKIEIVEEPIPQAPPKGLVIKTHYAGVCHTDVHLWLDKCRVDDQQVVSFTEHIKDYKFPIVMGHEIAGEVYEIGKDACPGAPQLKVGDHVLIYPWTGCNNCGMCRTGEDNMCEESLARAYGIGKDGGHQAYMRVDSRLAVQKLPAGVGLDVANMLTCSALTAYNAITSVMSAVEQGATFTASPRLLIVGAGGLGLWAIQWAKALCPPSTKVFVADVAPEKLEEAKKHGADEGILWSKTGTADDVAEQVIRQCGGKLDASADFVGSASTATRVFKAMRNGGTQALIGLAGGTLPVPVLQSAINMVNIRGVYVGNPKQMQEVTQYVAEKKVRSPPLHVFKPEQCGDVMQMLVDGQLPGRAILDFTSN